MFCVKKFWYCFNAVMELVWHCLCITMIAIAIMVKPGWILIPIFSIIFICFLYAVVRISFLKKDLAYCQNYFYSSISDELKKMVKTIDKLLSDHLKEIEKNTKNTAEKK